MGRPEGDRASEDGDEPRVDRSPRGNWIETVAAVVSTLLVTFVVGFIVYEAITSPADGVPHLVVTVERVERQDGGHHVAFRAINSGSAAAAAVRVAAGDNTAAGQGSGDGGTRHRSCGVLRCGDCRIGRACAGDAGAQNTGPGGQAG